MIDALRRSGIKKTKRTKTWSQIVVKRENTEETSGLRGILPNVN